MLVSGCASTGTSAMPLPPAKMLQPADLTSLAGEWQGTWKAGRGTSPAGAGVSAVGDVTFAADGAYTSNVSGVPGVGRVRIEGGKLIFVGSATRGTATLHEGDGRRVLKGQGTWAGLDGITEFEITKR
jgi:hypothetical protein